jgi:hypothetical protein
MSYLKWLLLFACVAYAAWPLLAKRPGQTRQKGKTS